MRRFPTLASGLLAGLVATLAPVGAQTPAIEAGNGGLKELARQARPSVVLLRVYDGSGRSLAAGAGTGFFVARGVLATNHHVIAKASRVGAVLPDGTEVPVTGVLAEDPTHDLALLALAADAAPLPLYDGKVEPGEQVVVLGNPEGLSGTLSTGIVSALRDNGLDEGTVGPLIQITAPISPGSSGSPVMNGRGEVLGVAVAVHRTGQNLNFAVPVTLLRQLLSEVDPGGDPVREIGGQARVLAGHGALARNLVISALIFLGLIFLLRRLR